MIPNRIVIDTNVCLDLFVFRDPRWQPLRAALEERQIEAVTRDDCRTEWLRVLEYKHLPLNEESRAAATLAFDALITLLASHQMEVKAEIRLPVCKDPDDQKFLELARDTGARTLLTKDKALLKLAKRTAKAGLFDIVVPEKWALPAEAG